MVVRQGEGAWEALDAAPPPWSVEGGPPTLQVVAHRRPDGARVLALTNDPGWVYTGRRETRAGRPIRLPPGVDVVPAPVGGVRVRVPEGTRRVLDALAGEALPIEDGVVRLPAFQYAALLRLE